MHELAVTKGIVEDVLKASHENNIIPKEIYIEIGSLTTYEKEPIEYYFSLLKKDHEEFSEAKLNIKIVEGNDVVIKKLIGK